MSEIKINNKDLPKIQTAPKPSDPLVWSVYLDKNNISKLRARLHEPGNIDRSWFDGGIEDPRGFVEVIQEWIRNND